MLDAINSSPKINSSNHNFDNKAYPRLLGPTNSRNPAQVEQIQSNSLPRRYRPKIKFEVPLEPIYRTVPGDFVAFIKEVNKAFGGQWAPRSAFEEIFQFYLDHEPKEKRKVAEMKKVMSQDYMTTYMLDAIEDGGMNFIRSLGEEWRPLINILGGMTLNERRSFCCKILYQRMKEMKLEELARTVVQPKPFVRETTPLTPEQKAKEEEDGNWDEHLPPRVREAYMAPKKLHSPHNIIVAQLQIRGYYRPPVEFMADFCVRAAYWLGLPCTGPVPLPRRTERWTVIKSPFIFKKQQENFERRTYSRLVTIKDGHPDVVEMWLSYCVKNMFHGTGMKAHVFTNDYVGVGKRMSEDIKQLIETDRWSVGGYNELSDDARGLQSTIDQEIMRIETEITQREDTERAKRILQLRVDELLKLEGVAEDEAMRGVQQREAELLREGKAEVYELEEDADQVREMRLDKRRKAAMDTLVKSLPKLDVEQLKKEVEWDQKQDEALRKHLLHVGMYAEQKGIAPLTREEYFVYVPYVLLPKYKGIHKDVFDLVEDRDLLRIPKGNSGYLADWENLTERQRYDIVVEHRKPGAEGAKYFQRDKMDTSRLARMIEKRRNRRKTGSLAERIPQIGQGRSAVSDSEPEIEESSEGRVGTSATGGIGLEAVESSSVQGDSAQKEVTEQVSVEVASEVAGEVEQSAKAAADVGAETSDEEKLQNDSTESAAKGVAEDKPELKP